MIYICMQLFLSIVTIIGIIIQGVYPSDEERVMSSLYTEECALLYFRYTMPSNILVQGTKP
jgi:hypothetical protein